MMTNPIHEAPAPPPVEEDGPFEDVGVDEVEEHGVAAFLFTWFHQAGVSVPALVGGASRARALSIVSPFAERFQAPSPGSEPGCTKPRGDATTRRGEEIVLVIGPTRRVRSSRGARPLLPDHAPCKEVSPSTPASSSELGLSSRMAGENKMRELSIPASVYTAASCEQVQGGCPRAPPPPARPPEQRTTQPPPLPPERELPAPKTPPDSLRTTFALTRPSLAAAPPAAPRLPVRLTQAFRDWAEVLSRRMPGVLSPLTPMALRLRTVQDVPVLEQPRATVSD